MNRVHIDWTGPLVLEAVLKLRGGNDYGIYQVYGQHVVFGAGSLLYIGKAERQTFGARFKQHDWWLHQEKGVEIFLGRVRDGDYEIDTRWAGWARVVVDAEALLIYEHSPPDNSRGIMRYEGIDKELVLENAGERGRLLAECAVRRIQRPDDAEAG